jgi:hypothetical protein
MSTHLEQLIALGGPSLGPSFTAIPKEISVLVAAHASRLEALLQAKNGFFAFESALHIFPVGSSTDGYDLGAWNSREIWRAEYADMDEGYLFFAEDIFGEQFAISGTQIGRFNPETGEFEAVATDLEEWARRTIENYPAETGYPVAHAWQETYGPLPGFKRLVPKVPFVGGGSFDLDNLYAEDAVQGMRSRANLARQIRDLPDGAQVKFAITD